MILIAINHMDRQTSVPTTPPLSSSITCLRPPIYFCIFTSSTSQKSPVYWFICPRVGRKRTPRQPPQIMITWLEFCSRSVAEYIQDPLDSPAPILCNPLNFAYCRCTLFHSNWIWAATHLFSTISPQSRWTPAHCPPLTQYQYFWKCLTLISMVGVSALSICCWYMSSGHCPTLQPGKRSSPPQSNITFAINSNTPTIMCILQSASNAVEM